MAITREQHKELLSMLQHLRYGEFPDYALKVLPLSKAERAALKLLARCKARRATIAKRATIKYIKAKEKARIAIFFGDDFKAALKAIEAAKALYR